MFTGILIYVTGHISNYLYKIAIAFCYKNISFNNLTTVEILKYIGLGNMPSHICEHSYGFPCRA